MLLHVSTKIEWLAATWQGVHQGTQLDFAFRSIVRMTMPAVRGSGCKTGRGAHQPETSAMPSPPCRAALPRHYASSLFHTTPHSFTARRSTPQPSPLYQDLRFFLVRRAPPPRAPPRSPASPPPPRSSLVHPPMDCSSSAPRSSSERAAGVAAGTSPLGTSASVKAAGSLWLLSSPPDLV